MQLAVYIHLMTKCLVIVVFNYVDQVFDLTAVKQFFRLPGVIYPHSKVSKKYSKDISNIYISKLLNIVFPLCCKLQTTDMKTKAGSRGF